jgi:hypothetical protein
MTVHSIVVAESEDPHRPLLRQSGSSPRNMTSRLAKPTPGNREQACFAPGKSQDTSHVDHHLASKPRTTGTARHRNIVRGSDGSNLRCTDGGNSRPDASCHRECTGPDGAMGREKDSTTRRATTANNDQWKSDRSRKRFQRHGVGWNSVVRRGGSNGSE